MERSEGARLRVKDGTIGILFSPCLSSTRVGWVGDMKEGVLDLTYIGDGERLGEPLMLRLYCTEEMDGRTNDIPCRITYDRPAPPVPYSTIGVRRCGVELGQLTEDQKSELQRLIENN